MILVATSADTGWTTWPMHKSYPPVMQEIVLQASAGRLSERNIRVGQPFDQSFPAAGASAAGHGGHTQEAVDRDQAAARRRRQPVPFRADRHGGRVPGQGRAAAGTRIVVRRQHQPRRERSDQARPRGLAEMLPGWNFLYLTNSRELAEDASSVGRRGELHRPLLYGLLILLLVESITGVEVRAP